MRIHCYPDPVLRRQAEDVEVIDEKLLDFAQEMVEEMYRSDGVGLAAPQVGRGLRLIAVDTSKEHNAPRVFLNPAITRRSKETESGEEGCLSLPGLHATVKRALAVTVEAQDLEGRWLTIEAEGFAARVFQHEIDHLEGVLFVDKVGPAAKFSLRGDLKRLEEAYESEFGSTPAE
jgi:peptide deformylase